MSNWRNIITRCSFWLQTNLDTGDWVNTSDKSTCLKTAWVINRKEQLFSAEEIRSIEYVSLLVEHLIDIKERKVDWQIMDCSDSIINISMTKNRKLVNILFLLASSLFTKLTSGVFFTKLIFRIFYHKGDIEFQILKLLKFQDVSKHEHCHLKLPINQHSEIVIPSNIHIIHLVTAY